MQGTLRLVTAEHYSEGPSSPEAERALARARRIMWAKMSPGARSSWLWPAPRTPARPPALAALPFDDLSSTGALHWLGTSHPALLQARHAPPRARSRQSRKQRCTSQRCRRSRTRRGGTQPAAAHAVAPAVLMRAQASCIATTATTLSSACCCAYGSRYPIKTGQDPDSVEATGCACFHVRYTVHAPCAYLTGKADTPYMHRTCTVCVSYVESTRRWPRSAYRSRPLSEG